MAGGIGSRMKSALPKILHIIDDKPMIYYIVLTAIHIGSSKIMIVVGKYKDVIKHQIDKYFPCYKDTFDYIDQEIPNGTGHAIQCCIPVCEKYEIHKTDNILILSGDVPLIKAQTLEQLLATPNSLLITKMENPFGNGRIIFLDDKIIKKDDKIIKIVEEKDCNEVQRKIQYVNCGIYNITYETLIATVPFIKNANKASEFYLTDFVEMAVKQDIILNHYELPESDQYQILNINTIEDLVKANEIIFTMNNF